MLGRTEQLLRQLAGAEPIGVGGQQEEQFGMPRAEPVRPLARPEISCSAAVGPDCAGRPRWRWLEFRSVSRSGSRTSHPPGNGSSRQEPSAGNQTRSESRWSGSAIRRSAATMAADRRIALPDHRDSDLVWLPALGSCRLEPLPGGWLVRILNDSPDETPATAIEVDLRHPGQPQLSMRSPAGQWSHRLSPRHAELLFLLAANPNGLSAGQLSEELFGSTEHAVAIRAELSGFVVTSAGCCCNGPTGSRTGPRFASPTPPHRPICCRPPPQQLSDWRGPGRPDHPSRWCTAPRSRWPVGGRWHDQAVPGPRFRAVRRRPLGYLTALLLTVVLTACSSSVPGAAVVAPGQPTAGTAAPGTLTVPPSPSAVAAFVNPPASPAAVPAGLEQYYSQQLDWEGCAAYAARRTKRSSTRRRTSNVLD